MLLQIVKIKKIMSMHNQTCSEFLPLDSAVKASSVPQYLNSESKSSFQISGQESQVSFLLTKIDQLQKNYVQLQKKYIKKIRYLKDQLAEKHKTSNNLAQQVINLSKQYERHKTEINKIYSEIKSMLDQNEVHTEKQHKIKSVSPKNHTNNSPKRLIKKSLEMARKQVVQIKKQTLSKQGQNSQQTNTTRNTQRSDKNMIASANHTFQSKKRLTIQIDVSKNSNENSLNSSNQIKNGRKILYSPSNQINGPSPKKKILFNSSKQLDLFSKPNSSKKLIQSVTNLSTRRTNNSPIQRKKQNIDIEKIITQKQIKKQLPIIDQLSYKIQKDQSHQDPNNISTNVPEKGRIKPYSPSNNQLKRKNIDSIGLLNKNKISNSFQVKKQLDQCSLKNISDNQTRKDQINKQKNKSPMQSSKNIKISPLSKFSPTRKLTQHSPTQKDRDEAKKLQKTKLFGNIKQKIDDKIFK